MTDQDILEARNVISEQIEALCLHLEKSADHAEGADQYRMNLKLARAEDLLERVSKLIMSLYTKIT